jgi:hypothetical protein
LIRPDRSTRKLDQIADAKCVEAREVYSGFSESRQKKSKMPPSWIPGNPEFKAYGTDYFVISVSSAIFLKLMATAAHSQL